jgi:hypothetical protein
MIRILLLAIQFWGLYTIVNEHGISLREEASDGEILRFTFRRIIDRRLFEQWQELLQIVDSMQFSEEDDTII